MTTIQPRSVWTSTKEGFSHVLLPGDVIGAVIHYPGDGNVTYAGRGVAHEKGRLRAYRNYHVGSRGWADIGYNLAIGQSGTAYWAAGKKKAAHCASSANPLANAKYFGILLILGDNERPSDAMIATLNEMLNLVRTWYPKATALLGHRQVYGASTACPGNVIMGLIDRGVIRYGTTPTVTPAPAPVTPAPAPSSKVWPEVALPLTDKHTTASHNAWVRLMADIGYKDPRPSKSLQRWLRDRGYYKGLIDGDFAGWSIDALQRFLRDRGFYKGAIDGKKLGYRARGPMTVRAEIAYLNSQRQYY